MLSHRVSKNIYTNFKATFCVLPECSHTELYLKYLVKFYQLFGIWQNALRQSAYEKCV